MKDSNINKLQRIQNNALRFINNIRYPVLITNNELHERSGLLTIKELLKQRASDIWNKIITSNMYQEFHDRETIENLQENQRFPISQNKLRL